MLGVGKNPVFCSLLGVERRQDEANATHDATRKTDTGHKLLHGVSSLCGDGTEAAGRGSTEALDSCAHERHDCVEVVWVFVVAVAAESEKLLKFVEELVFRRFRVVFFFGFRSLRH